MNDPALKGTSLDALCGLLAVFRPCVSSACSLQGTYLVKHVLFGVCCVIFGQLTEEIG